ncbi:MAG: response regulator [Rubrimonas sp.]|uniref:response regulator n=1 Tax=Rubrimonas sp. TaxID=2036015 RepID=UPI002FDE04AD
MSKTVLAVEDSPSVRQLIRMTLLDYGYDVSEAKNGAEALQKTGGARFDAVVTDINMPVMNGIEFIRQFRATPQSQGVPVIVLTTESGDAMKAEAREAGATAWLTKPFTQQQLLDALRKVAGA